MEKQKTISSEISVQGIGLHTANKANARFRPADVDTGIRFIRVDLADKPVIEANVESLLSPELFPRRTSIGNSAAHVQTIEHLMAALAGLSIDNLIVEIDNSEMPGLDGSSLGYIEVLEKAGLEEQDKERHYYQVKEPLYAEEKNCSIVALPSDSFKISYTLDYKEPICISDFLEVDLTNPASFKSDISGARTFCLEEEVSELQRQGIGKGANYENTLVIGKSGIVKNKLRYEDEFIRHKILDLIGDLYLVGVPIKCHVFALKSGHNLNLKLAKKIYQQRQKNLTGGIRVSYHPKEGEELDINKIMKILPHREPFLFVDKIVSLEQGKRAVGIKNVTINDYFFKGHFPGKPVMPGVIIIEAMAQVGGVMMLAPEENRGKLAYFMALNNVKFRKTVVPGDQLVLEVEAGKMRSKTGQVHGKAMVDGKIVAEADLMFALAEA